MVLDIDEFKKIVLKITVKQVGNKMVYDDEAIKTIIKFMADHGMNPDKYEIFMHPAYLIKDKYDVFQYIDGERKGFFPNLYDMKDEHVVEFMYHQYLEKFAWKKKE